MARGTIIGTETKLVVEVCCTCGITFGMPVGLWEVCRQKGQDFYCPNGHQMVFTEPEVSKLTRERDKAITRCAELELEKNKLRGHLDEALDTMNQHRKRANAGLCPHCRRNFANVRRHIETKHPDKLQ